MPMDATDSRLLKGLTFFALLGLSVYYYPFSWPMEGYVEQVQELEKAKEEIGALKDEYRAHYNSAPQEAFGVEAAQPTKFGPIKPYEVSFLQGEYEKKKQDLKDQILEKQAASRMTFAEWTNVPKRWDGDEGPYFERTYTDRQKKLKEEWQRVYVEVVDDNIGFDDFIKKRDLRMSPERAQEMLRELYIAETVIRLCIKAKVEQKAAEEKLSLKTVAFMRIISVVPLNSVATGPYIPVINPEYEKKKNDPRVQPYTMKPLKKFIREYPVEILLQCDFNSFRRFLSSVRSPGQFLVIRTLKMVSPFLNDSKKDKSDFASIVEGKNSENKPDWLPEHIFVRISAAGMDFFDPDNFLDGTGKMALLDASGQPLPPVRVRVEPTGN